MAALDQAKPQRQKGHSSVTTFPLSSSMVKLSVVTHMPMMIHSHDLPGRRTVKVSFPTIESHDRLQASGAMLSCTSRPRDP